MNTIRRNDYRLEKSNNEKKNKIKYILYSSNDYTIIDTIIYKKRKEKFSVVLHSHDIIQKVVLII